MRLGVLLFLSVLAGCAASERHADAGAGVAERGAAKLELRLASLQPGADLALMRDPEGRAIHVAPTVELSESDVTQARAFHGEVGSFVELTLAPEAAARFAQLTRENIGGLLAIVVNDELVAAPLIQSEVVSGRAYISGRFSRERAEQLAAAIAGR